MAETTWGDKMSKTTKSPTRQKRELLACKLRLEREERDIENRLDLAYWELCEVQNGIIKLDKQMQQIEAETNAQHGVTK